MVVGVIIIIITTVVVRIVVRIVVRVVVVRVMIVVVLVIILVLALDVIVFVKIVSGNTFSPDTTPLCYDAKLGFQNRSSRWKVVASSKIFSPTKDYVILVTNYLDTSILERYWFVAKSPKLGSMFWMKGFHCKSYR